MSICRSLYENVTYEFVLAFSEVPHVLFVLLGWFVRWEVGGRTDTVLWDEAQHILIVSVHVVNPYGHIHGLDENPVTFH